MARIRKLLSLDPEVEAHRKALAILEAHGCSSDFVVECILKYDQALTKKELQQELQIFFQEYAVAAQPLQTTKQQVEQDTADQYMVNEIPDVMFDILKQL